MNLDTSCNIFDLSGGIPFTVYVNVSRRHGQARQNSMAYNQSVDVVTNGTLLDVSGALFGGLLLYL